jgi:hypothetical protein
MFDGTPCLYLNYNKHNWMNPNKIVFCIPPYLFKFQVQILSSITNKMQCYTIFFITVNVLHVSGGFSAHHQWLKTVQTASGISQACLLLPLAWVSWNNSPTLVVAASKLDIYQMLFVQF